MTSIDSNVAIPPSASPTDIFHTEKNSAVKEQSYDRVEISSNGDANHAQAAAAPSGDNHSKSFESTASNKDDKQYSDAEQKEIKELAKRDQEVRMHEQSHLAAAGGLAVGGATYTYEVGPDGKRYAVSGEVSIDVSEVPDNPEATIQKALTVRRAALAPSDPSGADRAVAAKAAALMAEARREISRENTGTDHYV